MAREGWKSVRGVKKMGRRGEMKGRKLRGIGKIVLVGNNLKKNR